MSGPFIMRLPLVALLSVCVLFQTPATLGLDCEWDKDVDFPSRQPFLMDLDAWVPLYPKEEGNRRIVRLEEGRWVLVACAGKSNMIAGFKVPHTQAYCSGGKFLTIDGVDYELSTLECDRNEHETVLRETGRCGPFDEFVSHTLAFTTTTSDHYATIKVCFDPDLETTLYSENVIHGANIEAKDVDSSRPGFKAASFFSVSMSKVYSKDTQLTTMEKLLGDADLASTIIDSSKSFFFSKGHLAPDADFVLEPEQDSTYYYINAVPQWQSFNNGNWKYLETAVRELAAAHKTDLKVWTGSYGILTLPDINNNPQEIYLGMADDKQVVPAPGLIWKVVYEESTSRAVAVVGVNNPHLESAPTPICEDICKSLSWVDWELENLPHGYMYCCTVDDLREHIPYVPALYQVDILDS